MSSRLEFDQRSAMRDFTEIENEKHEKMMMSFNKGQPQLDQIY